MMPSEIHSHLGAQEVYKVWAQGWESYVPFDFLQLATTGTP